MAWTSIIKHGETVVTEHGTGVVKRISEANGTAQVEVNGQLYEVPAEQLTPSGETKPATKPEGDKPVKQLTNNNVKKGDRVQTKDGAMKGEVKEVTQRSVKVEFDNGLKQTFEKRSIAKHLDREGSSTPKGDETEIKIGDRVEAVEDIDWVKQGQTGTVKEVNDGSALVKWDNADGRGHGNDDDEWHQDLEYIKKIETQQPESAQAKETVSSVGDGLHEILKLKEYMETKIDKQVDGELEQLREMTKKTQKLEVKVGDKTAVLEGMKHKQLEQLITYAALRLSPLLVGMAGTGKTHAGEQTAKALDLPFYSMSVGAQTSKSDIIGYQDASGRYVRTHFREAYENGGVFLMDEIDAGNANVLIQVNAALSNGLCAFPDKMVERHKDFVFIASANTFGNGANRQYVGRNQLDAATLDRFAVIEWFIDDELESSLTTGINGKAWYMAVRAARDYVAEKKIRALISPRATQKGSRLLDVGQNLDEVINATLLASVPEDKKKDVTQVAKSIFEKFASEVPGQLPKTVNPEVGDLLRDIPF